MSFIAFSYFDHPFRMRGWLAADVKLRSSPVFSSSTHVLDVSAASPRVGARGCAKEQWLPKQLDVLDRAFSSFV
jgi:hypothetical protein